MGDVQMTTEGGHRRITDVLSIEKVVQLIRNDQMLRSEVFDLRTENQRQHERL